MPWAELARHVDLVRPRQSSYDTLRLTPNPRYDNVRPLALLEARSPSDVATGLAFAADHGVPLALRAGGHSYPGWSAGAGALVIDTRRMNQVVVDRTTATIGPGAQLADVYSGLAAAGRALPGGSCPTVAVAGLTLGGGVGVLARALGLTCDHLTGAQIVLADGRTATASRDVELDLFWALRGGGGGHLGVVTEMTFATVEAPTLSTTYLSWPVSTAGDVVSAWFDWMSSAPSQLWSTLKLLAGDAHPSGPRLSTSVTWTGPADGFEAALKPILATKPTVRVDHRHAYLEAMDAYAPSEEREAFAATSHVAYDPLPPSAIDTLASLVSDGAEGLHEAGVSFDALGGLVATVDETATAFVHRQALATVQYTATYDQGGPARAQAFVRQLREAMTPFLGDHAYVNYADSALQDAGESYFGANWPRLQQVRATYDPSGLFTQPG